MSDGWGEGNFYYTDLLGNDYQIAFWNNKNWYIKYI